MSKITPFIWFQGNAEEAMNFYADVFPDSKIVEIERYAGDQGIPGEAGLKGKVLTGIFEVMGREFMCIDGGAQFELTGAISLLVEFDDQQQIDAAWSKLMEGGSPQQCGWITDRFGVTWQITPTSLGQMMSDPGATAKQKTALMQAMMPMIKLETTVLEEAFRAAK